jgi:hypothetical protein
MARRPTPSQIAAFEALLEKADAEVRDAFLAAVYSARSKVDLGALVAMIEAGDIEGVIALLRMDQGVLWPLEEALRRSYLAGGVAVDAFAPTGIEGRFGFNGRHLRAEADIARIGGDLVRTLEREQNEAIRAVLLDAIERNRSSSQTALEIVGRKSLASGLREGGIVGLSGPQTDRYLKVQRLMQTAEGVQELVVKKNGLLTVRYKVNAATSNRIIAAYRKGGAVAAPDQTISERQYKNQLLRQRGQLIAQNEAHTAQSAGRHEAYRQMLDRPDIEAVTCKWIHGFSRDARPDHKRMDGEVRNFGEGFVMDDGTVMQYPHDPAGGVRHSASCRCTAFYRAIPRRS